LYLFAAFREIGYLINRSSPVPDFSCINAAREFCVEATTVNSSESGPLSNRPDLETSAGSLAFAHEYMPMKYGSALHSKLRKKYWNAENVKGKPLILPSLIFKAINL
jgi:hypothetical protein